MTTAILAFAVLAQPQEAQLKKYEEVVTADAVTQDGLFKIHKVGEKWYFEIPKDKLGRDMLWQSQQVEIPHQLGGPGYDRDRLVRWERRGNKIHLLGIDTSKRGYGQGAEYGVKIVSPPAIIKAFSVETESAGSAPVFNVTDFLVSDPPDFKLATSWNASLDGSRCYVEGVKAFPENIEARALLSYTLQRVPTFERTFSSHAADMGPNASVLMNYSFRLLPESPMKPRYRDPRIGYFGTLVEEYDGTKGPYARRELAYRFRLVKRDPNAAVSEPVKPIVFTISRETPRKWIPYIVKGVEAWRPAFEQAGFRNAIRAEVAPEDLDQEDSRYSMIRWSASDFENAVGMITADPRSGEIMNAQVVFYHNFLGFLEGMYFSQVAALDSSARKLPFGDELMGKLVQYVITHEIGHAIGLEHNMKASSSVTVAQLRDPAFVREHDIAPSIMDYARFNFVAQPGDGVPLDRNVGAYDRHAIEWGYRQFDGDEERQLELIASRGRTNAALRFGNYYNPLDPHEGTEDIGDDPIAVARLGMLNLKRSANMLVDAATENGQDYTRLQRAHAMLTYQWRMELEAIVRLVGSVHADGHLMHAGGVLFRPVPKEKQRQAVQFLCGPEGVPPKELVAPAIAQRLFPTDAIRRVVSYPNTVVYSILSDARIQRMLDYEAIDPGRVYTVADLLQDVQDGIWRQLETARPQIDAYERNMQRNYLIVLDAKLNLPTAVRTDLLPLGRASLRALAKRIDKAIPTAADEITALHLSDCRRQIESIVLAKSNASALVPTSIPSTATPPATNLATTVQPDACFPFLYDEALREAFGLQTAH